MIRIFVGALACILALPSHAGTSSAQRVHELYLSG